MIPPLFPVLVLAAALSVPPHAIPQREPHAVTQRVHSGPRGVASWYRWHPGEAAAGPALRAFLGAHWRGTVVTVTANGHSVRVQLSDWCRCPSRLIDLGADSFARLAPLSRGLVKVSVTR
jgi:rare lipoprotein A (peptidoglycan hydrolase)